MQSTNQPNLMFYGQNIQDSLRSQQKSNNLIVDTEPFEEYNDLFLNQSLSEGFFSIDMNHQNKKDAFQESCGSNEQEVICIPPLSIQAETQRDLFSFPQTPNPKLLGQQLFSSITHKEIDSRKYSYTSSLLDKGIMTHTRNVYQNLYQYFLLKTFIKKLSNKKNMNSSFNQYHFNVINDKGSVMNMKLFKDNALRIKPLRSQSNRGQEIHFRQIVMRPITKWMGQIYIKTNQIIERIPIFYPESMQKLIWDGFIQIARIYFMFMIPLDLSFNQEQFMFGYNYKATVVMIMMLLFDLLVSFNTAHYKQGQIVTDRLQIARNVIAKSGGLELLSISMLVVIWSIKQYQVDYTVDASIQLYQLGLMIFFIQYKNISKFIRQVEQAMNLSKSTKAILELLKLIVGVIVVLHVFACLWYWAGYYSHITWGKSWLDLRGLTNEKWQEDYLYSFYYSTVTMFTVGYGDITPQSDLETIISIFFMMITSIQLSYSVSTVGAIIDKISAYEEEKLKKLHTINTFMQTKKIGYQLQYQVREYLNYYWQAQNEEDSQKEKAIIDQLSENLRERLMLSANSLILNNCVLFRNHFSAELKIQLVKCIKQVVVQPENVIDFNNLFPGVRENQIYLCFIEKGSIEIFIEKETNILNSATNTDVSIVSQINEGDSLGVISFLTGKKSIERFRSIGFTKLLLLSRDDFLKIIPDFPEDYEQYSYFQDQLELYQRSKFLNMECFSCKSPDHKALDCPLLHFIPDREFLIKKYQFSRNQERNEPTKNQNIFKRGGKKGSVNARLDQDYVQESAIVFQNDHWQESMFFECDDEQPLNLHSSLNMTTDAKYVGNIKPEEETFKKSTTLTRQQTRNFQSTSNIEDSLKEIFPISDHDVSQKSSIKKTKKSVGFKNQEISNVQKLISPLPLLENVIEEDQIEESRVQQIPKLSNFSLKLTKTNSIFPQQSKFQPVKLSPRRSLKNKFQKAVRIINTLKTIAKLKPLKRCRSMQESSSIIEQDRVSRVQFERNQLQNLIKRRNLINVNKNITNNYAALKQDNQNAEFTILKLQMMLELRIPLNNFEHLKTFKFYFPYNNVDHVLYQQESYYKPNQEHVKQLPQIFSQLVTYMLYPYEYIEKYIFTSINKKSPPPIKRQRTIYPGGILNPQKRKFSKKSLSTRKNQIRPQSDGQMLQKKTTRFQK